MAFVTGKLPESVRPAVRHAAEVKPYSMDLLVAGEAYRKARSQLVLDVPDEGLEQRPHRVALPFGEPETGRKREIGGGHGQPFARGREQARRAASFTPDRRRFGHRSLLARSGLKRR